MAAFPNSVKSFTTKNAGDTIQPSDVDDCQDEIAAIEAGYLTGTAQLNSSNSTLANLSVAGKSTLVGNVQMNGNCTVTGTLTVTGAVSFAAQQSFASVVTADAQPRCKALKTSTQSVTNATWTALTFDTDEFNVGALHSTGTNPSRIKCTSTGLWIFGAVVASTLNSQSGFLSFRKNGATFVGTRLKFLGNSSLTESGHLTTIDQITSSNDYMEVMVFQNVGVAVEFGTVSSSRVDQPEFWAAKLW